MIKFSLFCILSCINAFKSPLSNIKRVMIDDFNKSIERNLTNALPIETHVLIDPMVQEVIYITPGIIDQNEEKMLKEKREIINEDLEYLNIQNSELAEKYAKKASLDIKRKLRAFPHSEIHNSSSPNEFKRVSGVGLSKRSNPFRLITKIILDLFYLHWKKYFFLSSNAANNNYLL